MKQLLFLLFPLFASQPTDSSKILGIFDNPSYSHQQVFKKIIKDLSDRGHHLTIVTVNRINDNFPNVTEILIEGSYERHIYNFAELKENGYSLPAIIRDQAIIFFKNFDYNVRHPEVRKLIENASNETFDLLLIDYIVYNPMLYFAEVYDCPVVALSSAEASNWIHSLFGNYINPAILPEVILDLDAGNMTMTQRFMSVVTEIVLSITGHIILIVASYRINKNYFPTVTASWSDIQDRRIEYLIQNISPVLGATRPVTHNTITIGNLNLESPNKLVDHDLESFLNSSKNGVVYVSFGTSINTNNIKSMPVFVNTFNNLKYDILWKLNDVPSNISSNIHTSKWYPQSDLLAHPNVKLFITHCGLSSLEESIDREVPVIAIPFQFDQFKNAFTVRREQIGMFLEYESLTEEVLHHAIMEVTTNPKFKENIKKLKTLMHDVPMPAREKAVWWIEYALRNKGQNKLKFFGNKIPFYQKFCLDIGLLVIGLLVLIIYFIMLIRRLFNVKKVKVE